MKILFHSITAMPMNLPKQKRISKYTEVVNSLRSLDKTQCISFHFKTMSDAKRIISNVRRIMKTQYSIKISARIDKLNKKIFISLV